MGKYRGRTKRTKKHRKHTNTIWKEVDRAVSRNVWRARDSEYPIPDPSPANDLGTSSSAGPAGGAAGPAARELEGSEPGSSVEFDGSSSECGEGPTVPPRRYECDGWDYGAPTEHPVHTTNKQYIYIYK